MRRLAIAGVVLLGGVALSGGAVLARDDQAQAGMDQFSASAVLPALSRQWQFGDGGRAGLTMAVQLGFIVGTLGAALGNLPDLVAPRTLMLVSALVGAAANAAVALWVDRLGPALALRFVTGLAMAGAYPPAMKIMATWFRQGRGTAIGVLVGALTLGSAAPHLIRGVSDLPWQKVLLCASGLAAAGALLVALLVCEGSHLTCLGYLGHMWELYAMWSWVGLFLADSLRARGGGSYAGLNPSGATFLVVAAGAPGGVLGGLADRHGRTTVTMAAMALSGLCTATIGLTYAGPPALTLAVALLWGLAVVADSAQFSTATPSSRRPPTWARRSRCRPALVSP